METENVVRPSSRTMATWAMSKRRPLGVPVAMVGQANAVGARSSERITRVSEKSAVFVDFAVAIFVYPVAAGLHSAGVDEPYRVVAVFAGRGAIAVLILAADAAIAVQVRDVLAGLRGTGKRVGVAIIAVSFAGGVPGGTRVQAHHRRDPPAVGVTIQPKLRFFVDLAIAVVVGLVAAFAGVWMNLGIEIVAIAADIRVTADTGWRVLVPEAVAIHIRVPNEPFVDPAVAIVVGPVAHLLVPLVGFGVRVVTVVAAAQVPRLPFTPNNIGISVTIAIRIGVEAHIFVHHAIAIVVYAVAHLFPFVGCGDVGRDVVAIAAVVDAGDDAIAIAVEARRSGFEPGVLWKGHRDATGGEEPEHGRAYAGSTESSCYRSTGRVVVVLEVSRIRDDESPSFHQKNAPTIVIGRNETPQKRIAKAWAESCGSPHKTSVFSIAMWKTPKNPGACGSATVRAIATVMKQAAAKGRSRLNACMSA